MEWKYDRMEERYDPMEWNYDPMKCKWWLDCIFVQNARRYLINSFSFCSFDQQFLLWIALVRQCIVGRDFGYENGLYKRSMKESMAWDGWETQKREPFECRGNMAVGTAGAWTMLLCFKRGLCTPANIRKDGIFLTLESGRRISGARWMLCLISKKYGKRATQGEKMHSKSTGLQGYLEVGVVSHCTLRKLRELCGGIKSTLWYTHNR